MIRNVASDFIHVSPTVSKPISKELLDGVNLLWGIKIPMRDGIKLDATLYFPREQEDPLPVILAMTPYVADTYTETALYFANNGYAFAIVDVRGRGNSEGFFEPLVNEGRDGYDSVEWLARQSWCNGKVGMWGGSYAGFVQWSTLKEFPPSLRTIVPTAAVLPGLDFPFFRNISFPYAIRWLTFTSGSTRNENLWLSSFWHSKFVKLQNEHLPFKDLDKIVGNTTTCFQKWIDHPVQDDYYSALTPKLQDYAKIDVPILSITGQYDGAQLGALMYYNLQMLHGSDDAKPLHYVVVGPWDHSGTRCPKKDFGGLKLGESGVLDLNNLHKEWYDWTMKGGRKPPFLIKNVAYYVTGSETWKYADELETIKSKRLKFYIRSSMGQADDVFRSGYLAESAPAVHEISDKYAYDPLDTRPIELETERTSDFITDQTLALNLSGNGLVYHSEPFRQDMEITGHVRLLLFIELDVPDTDFYVELSEIRPDSTSVLLTCDLMRARYRDSLIKETLVRPGEINLYAFEHFFFFSRKISKRSRLRLVLTCPNTVELQKNYNSGKANISESGRDARTAHVVVHHDSDHPSFLEIPVAEQEKSEGG